MSPSRRLLLAGLPPWLFPWEPAGAADGYALARKDMVERIELLMAAGVTGSLREIDGKVLRAMAAVPRHLFVPQAIQAQAYQDTPLPIGHDATISQPLIVAVMTELARTQPAHTVLEVGTGSGYQAAILSGLVRQVYSIELVEPLGRAAAERLSRMGYRNVAVRIGDGYLGWPERAPFDSILVTAGAPYVPPALIRQLKPGGRMVIPVGPGDDQRLQLVDKDAQGRVRQREVMKVIFVPLRETEHSAAGGRQ